MSIGVRDAATRLGVSRQRVSQMIDAGVVPAFREGRDWRIDPANLPRADELRVRALSQRMAWALIAMADGRDAESLSAAERSRARRYLARLGDSNSPAALMRSWMQARGERLCFAARDAEYLRADPRLRLSGLSSPMARLSSGGEVEAYLSANDLDDVVNEHMLEAASPSRAGVVLHVVSPDIDMGAEVNSALLVAADLAEHRNRQGREDARVAQIVDEVLDG